ncbi:T9SS type A sorting domain-containing protein [Thalassobellus citreus]|uniref:T9SS type A sorting domain-containing protein n=1 Tax=Thalassobellus citreus TaxID=3367752 RepID=UPI0037BB512A
MRKKNNFKKAHKLLMFMCLFNLLNFNYSNAQELLKGTIIWGPTGPGIDSGNNGTSIPFDGITAADNLGNFFEIYGKDGENDGWIGLELAKSAKITKVRVFPRGMTEVWTLDRIKGGTFEGANSSDFSDAVVLATVSGLPNLGNWTEFTVNIDQNYKYIRYKCPDLSTSTTGPTASLMQISELEFYGIDAVCDPVTFTQSVTINSTTIEQNYANINIGDSVEFTVEPSTDISSATKKWTGPNNFNATSLSISLSNVQISDSGSYSYIYTNDCGEDIATIFYLTVKDDSTTSFSNWPVYDNTLQYDWKSEYPDFPIPIKNLEEDYPGYSGCDVAWSRNYGAWTFNAGSNANALVTDTAVDLMLKRLDEDFSFLINNMGWPPDKLYRAGYRSSVYLFGSNLCTDNEPNTALGGWQSGVKTHDDEVWPMVLLSYYPVNSFDPNTTLDGAQFQTGAVVHEGIHALQASLPGCKEAAWFHEGSDVWLQTLLDIEKTGVSTQEDYDKLDLGWLSMGSILAPFIPIESYTGWLQDGTFGGPSAQGVHSGKFNSENQLLLQSRQVIGGMQYSTVFPAFMTEIVGVGSLAWIWKYSEGRVLEGIANGSSLQGVNGIGEQKTRTLIQEYRARLALADFGKLTEPILNMYRNNMGNNVGPEQPALVPDLQIWKATPYAKTTKDSEGYLIPEERTLPGWSGANIIPIHVTGDQATVLFKPLGSNMSVQLCYRTKAGDTFYSQPSYAGNCSISFDGGQPANGVIFAVICNSDYIYEGETTRTTKFNYKLKLGEGAVYAAGIHKNWWDWKATITDTPLSTNDFSENTSNFIIYPNPSKKSSLINIKLENVNITNYSLKVINLNGQVLYNKENCKKHEQFSTSKLAKGIYFISVKSQNLNQTKKLIIQ